MKQEDTNENEACRSHPRYHWNPAPFMVTPLSFLRKIDVKISSSKLAYKRALFWDWEKLDIDQIHRKCDRSKSPTQVSAWAKGQNYYHKRKKFGSKDARTWGIQSKSRTISQVARKALGCRNTREFLIREKVNKWSMTKIKGANQV